MYGSITGNRVLASLILTSTADGGDWLTARPGCSTPLDTDPDNHKKWRLSGPQMKLGRFGKDKNTLPLNGIEPRSVQPVALSLYSLRSVPENRKMKAYERVEVQLR